MFRQLSGGSSRDYAHIFPYPVAITVIHQTWIGSDSTIINRARWGRCSAVECKNGGIP